MMSQSLIYGQLTIDSTNYHFTNIDTKDGLADNWMHDALLDSRGLMWLATNSDLCSFDGHRFKHYRPKINDPYTLSGQNVLNLIEDKDGTLWIATVGEHAGLNHFDPITQQFEYFNLPIQDSLVERSSASYLFIDDQDQLWVASYDIGFSRFNKESRSFKRYNLTDRPAKTQAEAFRKNSVHVILQDQTDKDLLWLAGNNGLYRFRPSTEKLEYIPFTTNTSADTVTAVLGLFQESPNVLWLGTWGMGMIRYQIDKDNFTYFMPSPLDFANQNFYANVIYDIEVKAPDQFWICSWDQGLLTFDKQTEAFKKVKHNPADPNSIRSEKLNGMYTDPEGRHWFYNFINGISVLDENNQRFEYIPIQKTAPCPSDAASSVRDFAYRQSDQANFLITYGCESFQHLDANGKLIYKEKLPALTPGRQNIFHLAVDDQQTVWIAGDNAPTNIPKLWTYKNKNTGLKPFQHPLLDSIPLHQYLITDILPSGDQIWLATDYEGLILFDKKRDTLISFGTESSNSIFDAEKLTISQLCKNTDGKIWIATLQNGVFAFDPVDESFDHYPAATENQAGLPGIRVTSIVADGTGKIWAGMADNGLVSIDPSPNPTGAFKVFDGENGLPGQRVFQLSVDPYHNIWISTNRGLCLFDQQQNNIITFEEREGIREQSFFEKGLFTTKDNRLLVGSTDGFYMANIDSIYQRSLKQPLLFTGFKLFEETYRFEKNINYIDQLDLNYNQNFFTIEFAALNYAAPENNRYAYQLEGYDTDWIFPADNRSFANYTKVPPGKYTFRLRTANPSADNQQQEITLNIHIASPPWKTWWAYLIYLCLISAVIYSLYRIQLRRRLEQEEAKRVLELNNLKSRLYTNITHEFRTPLTLIKGPVERALQTNEPLPKTDLDMIHRNSEQLLQMINQIMDMRKMEFGNLSLNYRSTEIVEFIRQLIHSFDSAARHKSVRLQLYTTIDEKIIDIDREKLQTIIANLLSNALKFSPSDSEIKILLAIEEKNPTRLRLSVQDHGPGIPTQEQEKIFQRFYQIEQKDYKIGGSGIGLSFSQELAHLMNGGLIVESTVGQGSTFSLTLPIQDQQTTQIKTSVEQSSVIDQEIINTSKEKENHQPLILIVEDNPDVSQYLSRLLDKYQIISAENGKTGLEKAKDQIPELIISDVMMPIMDGYEFCQQIKRDVRTSHIPVILLTAKSNKAARLEGLEQGADLYLSKPFNEQELTMAVHNIIQTRLQFQKHFQQASIRTSLKAEVKENIPKELNKETQFLQSFNALIHEHIENPDLEVGFLCTQLGMSHTQLHRKLVALTGEPPIRLIRQLRIERAKLLLEDNNLNISEVAFKTGFNSAAYFSRTFKTDVGLSPSQYRNKINRDL